MVVQDRATRTSGTQRKIQKTIVGRNPKMSNQTDPFASIINDTPVTMTDSAPSGPDTAVDVTPDASGTDDSKPYPNVLCEVQDENDPNLAQYGELLNSTDFSKKITFKLMIADGKGADGYVAAANVYAAMKAKRHPLPVVIVAGTALIPWDLGSAAWDERPVRGEGETASSGVLTDEELLVAYGRALATLDKRVKLLKRAQEVHDKFVALVTKRESQLSVRNMLNDETKDKAARAYAESESQKDASKEVSDDNDES